MAGAWGQSILRVQISNKTRNTTLKYHRTDNHENFSHLTPELPSERSDSCCLLSSSNALGRGWLLIYEADSFTLAIFFFFFLPKEPEHSRKILQLEVSQDKAHLGDFRETFDRMTSGQNPPDPDKTVGFCARFSGQGEYLMDSARTPIGTSRTP